MLQFHHQQIDGSGFIPENVRFSGTHQAIEKTPQRFTLSFCYCFEVCEYLNQCL